MKYKLSDICEFAKEKIDVANLDVTNYISTENMVPDKGGVSAAAALPSVVQTQGFSVGDTLVSNIRPYFKKIWYAKNDGGCSNDVLVFRAKEGVNSRFLYYVLADDKFFGYAMATSKGTKMPRGDKKAIMEYAVPAISYDTQCKVADMLSSIDDKIETNTAINKNLEEQAQAIFKEMVSDGSAGSVKFGTLSDIAEITMGQSPKGDTYNKTGEGTVFYQGRAEFGFRFPTQRLFTTEPKRMAQEDDVLMSVRAPVGDINVARENCCIGRGLASIRSKFGYQSFVLYTMYSLREQMDVFNGEGTVFGAINRAALNALPVVIPPKEHIERFESIVSPMDASIRINHEEICRLEAIRDTLLPRLMSGEIDVSDIEI